MTLPGTASGSSSQTVPFNWESPEIKGDTLATDGRRLHPGEEECGGEGLESSGRRDG